MPSRVFDLLDQWRHLPDYQLERRADIFFATYLPRFLSHHLGVDLKPTLIPEFPVRHGTIDPNSQSNLSCKIDYLALTVSNSRAYFIELKTDGSSRRDEQDRYLLAAQNVGLRGLLTGVLQIVAASNQTRKYCHLLRFLADHGLLKLPAEFDAAVASRRHRAAVNDCLKRIEVIAIDPPVQVVFVQPVASGANEIGFGEMAAWLEDQADPLAARFALSLRQWAKVLAGDHQPARTSCGA